MKKKLSDDQLIFAACKHCWPQWPNDGWEKELGLILFILENGYDPHISLTLQLTEKEYNEKIEKWVKSENGQEFAFIIQNPAENPTLDDLYNGIMTTYNLHKEGKSLFKEVLENSIPDDQKWKS